MKDVTFTISSVAVLILLAVDRFEAHEEYKSSKHNQRHKLVVNNGGDIDPGNHYKNASLLASDDVIRTSYAGKALKVFCSSSHDVIDHFTTIEHRLASRSVQELSSHERRRMRRGSAFAAGFEPTLAKDGRNITFDEKAREDAHRKSEAAEHPYAVGLVLFKGKEKQSYCSGTLLSQKWVLTAAHCLYGPDAVEVYAGDVVVSLEWLGPGKLPANAQMIRSDRLLPHPAWTGGASDFDHDVGLIGLEEGFNLTDYVRPIGLSTEPWDQRGYRGCVMTAFGSARAGESSSDDYARKTQELEVKKPCACAFFLKIAFGPSAAGKFLCSKGRRGHGVCGGDSGSGLVCAGKVRAVASLYVEFWSLKLCKMDIPLTKPWGRGCGRGDTLNAFHDACPYLRWINWHTRVLDDSDVTRCDASGADGGRRRLAAGALLALVSLFAF